MKNKREKLRPAKRGLQGKQTAPESGMLGECMQNRGNLGCRQLQHMQHDASWRGHE
jgi:hypothetical protein